MFATCPSWVTVNVPAGVVSEFFVGSGVTEFVIAIPEVLYVASSAGSAGTFAGAEETTAVDAGAEETTAVDAAEDTGSDVEF